MLPVGGVTGDVRPVEAHADRDAVEHVVALEAPAPSLEAPFDGRVEAAGTRRRGPPDPPQVLLGVVEAQREALEPARVEVVEVAAAAEHRLGVGAGLEGLPLRSPTRRRLVMVQCPGRKSKSVTAIRRPPARARARGRRRCRRRSARPRATRGARSRSPRAPTRRRCRCRRSGSRSPRSSSGRLVVARRGARSRSPTSRRSRARRWPRRGRS